MSLTPARLSRRYAPLIALAAVQVLLVAVAPSGPPKATSSLAATAQPGFTPGGALAADATGADATAGVDGSTVTDSGAAAGTGGSSATGGGSGVTPAAGTTKGATGASQTAGSPGATGTAAGSTSGAAATAAAGGPKDLSKCDAKGRQIGPTYFMPTCQPVWHGGDNGGSTMAGVTATEVRFLIYEQQGDAQVNAILGTQGLASSSQQRCLARDAFTKELNKRWEFYGRKLVPVDGFGTNKGSTASGNDCGFPFFLGQCKLSPPDPPCARQEAEIIATQIKPAFVIGGSGNTFYNELAKRGVPSFGGSEYPANYYADFSPNRYDVLMDGTRSAKLLAEYYCKKLAGKPVAHAGPDVMGVNPPKRKVGIIYPKTYGDPVTEDSANLFVNTVGQPGCNGGEKVNAYSYESDINKAQQQSTTTVSSLKQDGITTVICFCDPIAPVFLTNTMDQQGYHPEQLMSGTGLIDYDVLGRLYNPNVWKYAFGPSHLALPAKFSESDATKAYQDAGASGEPDTTENLLWAYFSLAGTAVQNAGPRLTPEAMRDGLFSATVRGGWQESGGNQLYPKIKFAAPDDYSGINDAREVYWCTARVSEVDGKAGSYQPVDGGHRYDLTEWPSGDPKVLPNAAC